MSNFDDLLKPKNKIVDKTKEIDKLLEEREQQKTVEIEPIIEENQIKNTQKSGYKEKLKDKITTQKQKFKKDEELTKEQRKNIKKKFFADSDISRKEQKRIDAEEHNTILDSQKMIIGLGFISVIFIFMLWQYNPGDSGITTIVILLGCFLFMPLGAVIGWMFLDPFMRCKIMRKMAKGRKNFGIVNFVGKGKKIITRIKNFDDDLIWIKNKCWALTRSGIYELDKNGDQATEKTSLDPDSFVTVTETVPTMFIDINSMQPLTFQETGREGIAPEELGSTLKGWVDNQMAKVMFLKKTLDAYFLIVILSAVASAFFGYLNNQEITELKEMVERLLNQAIIKIF